MPKTRLCEFTRVHRDGIRETKTIENKADTRFVSSDVCVEMRADDSDGDASPVIEGYAAVFNEQIEFPGWQIRETIAEGAFTRSIKEDDVRSLWNHNSDFPLGRNRAKPSPTLILEEDSHGLATRTFPPDTQAGRDAIVSIGRGDVSQMSFGFFVTKEEWEKVGEWENRTILEVELFDVSPVTFPAYEATSVSVERGAAERALESRAAWESIDAKPETNSDIKGTPPVAPAESEALAEMKAQQAELEDSITWGSE